MAIRPGFKTISQQHAAHAYKQRSHSIHAESFLRMPKSSKQRKNLIHIHFQHTNLARQFAKLVETLLSGQLYLQSPLQNPVLLNSHTKLCGQLQLWTPFFASRGCLLMSTFTVVLPHDRRNWLTSYRYYRHNIFCSVW